MSRRGTKETANVIKPRGGLAVMQQRREPPDSLDFFPTPPWATRALIEHIIKPRSACLISVWEPAAGAGHMADVLRESFAKVHASDVWDYGRGYQIWSFTAERVGLVDDMARWPGPVAPDWIITNPPFNEAEAFARRGVREAQRGVALLVRSSWLEGVGRYEELFSKIPPAVVAMFVERVPMVKGRWDPDASTATSYAWVVWDRVHDGPTQFAWIPPGCREKLTKPTDRRTFAPETVPGLAETMI
ncbi:MAG: methyltransferase [Hyphomicrobium sp.]|nr:MAG: methyltransferase [Hyphomicrobium sp.]